MTYGLTVTGFVPKTLIDIKLEIEQAQQASFGQSINLAAKSVFGQLNGIMSDRFAELWEVAQEIDASMDPDRATAASLDGVCAFTGTIREKAKKSLVTATCTGTGGTVLPAGRIVSVVSTSVRFDSTTAVTLLTAAPRIPLTFFPLGQRVRNGSNIYQCVQAGLTDGGLGPSGTGEAIADGAVLWSWVGAGTAYADVELASQREGPFVALAGTLTIIETPVSGWQNVRNLQDAVVGNDIESDADLRLRREAELSASGDATVNAIRARVLRVNDGTINAVTDAYVFMNTTMSTDVDGLPPKSVEVLVQGGLDADLRQAIFDSVAAGIETYGAVSGTVTDDSGQVWPVKYSRPTERLVYVTLHVNKDPKVFPVDGETQLKAAQVVKYPVGKDVTASAAQARAFSVPGVLDVTACYIGLSPSPATSVTVTCDKRQIAKFDTSRVVVVLSDGSP
jgi:uncharacterized phage protein gp47/JayE